jgi:hypothetical protein
MPDLWRGERWIASKPSSNTSVGATLRTGPNFSTVVRRTIASTSRISSSVRPEYAFANGTELAALGTLVPHRERVVGVEARAAARGRAARRRAPRRSSSGRSSTSTRRRRSWSAHAVARVASLEHEALDAAVARLPRAAPHSPAQLARSTRGDRTSRASSIAATSASSRSASLLLRPVAQVDAVLLEHVVASSATGVAASTFGVSALRPMRVCSAAKGCGMPSRHATTSPSRTVPLGNRAPSDCDFGKAIG